MNQNSKLSPRFLIFLLAFLGLGQIFLQAQNKSKQLALGAYVAGEDSVWAVFSGGKLEKPTVKKVFYENTNENKQEIEDFSFMVGSCAMHNGLNFTNLRRPDATYRIFKSMKHHIDQNPNDFMLWLGDNVYLPGYFRDIMGTSPIPKKLQKWQQKNKLYEGFNRTYYRYYTQKKRQRFSNAIPNYVCPDDHDIGSNDTHNQLACFNNVGKKVAFQYYPNDNYERVDSSALYYKFYWKDCLFLVLDGRSEANLQEFSKEELAEGGINDCGIDEGTEKYWLSKRQLDWLEKELKTSKEHSDINFRFIVSGPQMLKQRGGYTTPHNFWGIPKQRQQILDLVQENQINGVLFLSGDVHYTELLKSSKTLKGSDSYHLYELTCSALSSPIHPLYYNKLQSETPASQVAKNKDIDATLGAVNQVLNVKRESKDKNLGSLVKKRNYGSISIVGEKNDRRCKMEIFDRKGHFVWRYEIKANDLKFE